MLLVKDYPYTFVQTNNDLNEKDCIDYRNVKWYWKSNCF